MEPTTTTVPVEVDLVKAGGDVRSDRETIHALRQGVEIDRRITVLDVADHRGGKHQVPITLTDHGTNGVTLQVAKDVVAEAERLAPGPRRRSGTVQLGSLDSFIAYVDRFKRPTETVAFAPLQPTSVTVIFDYHPQGGELAAWREDRATYTCPVSRQWKLWTEAASKPMGQIVFGDLIEANADDLGPGDGDFVSAPDLLKVARNLVVLEKGEFSRTVDPTSGTGTLTCKTEHDTKSTPIPKGFRLAVQVFEGAEDKYVLECRIRFAMDGGRPAFTFLIHNQAEVWEDALKHLRDQIGGQCQIPVFVGTAPQASR